MFPSPLTLYLISTVSFSDADKAAILELVTQFSSLQGLPAQSFIGEAYVNFGVFGITFYRDFYIQKEIPLPALTSDMLDLIKHLPSYLLAEDLSK